jgi:hypothetical protein
MAARLLCSCGVCALCKQRICTKRWRDKRRAEKSAEHPNVVVPKSQPEHRYDLRASTRSLEEAASRGGGHPDWRDQRESAERFAAWSATRRLEWSGGRKGMAVLPTLLASESSIHGERVVSGGSESFVDPAARGEEKQHMSFISSDFEVS